MDGIVSAAWAALLLVPAVVLGAALIWTASLRRRLARRLDALWGWLGDDLRVGTRREWEGEIDGRRVSVEWFDDTTEVRVEAHPRVRIGFARDEDPSDALPEVGRAYPIEDGGVAWTDEPERLDALVGLPGVREALRALLADDGASRRSVELSPTDGVGWLVRDLPDHRFGPADTERWVHALVRLAGAAEAL